MSAAPSRAEQSATIDALRASVRNFVSRQPGLGRVRSLRDRHPGYERTMWREMAALGWLGVMVPEDLQGAGLGLAAAVAVAEELSSALAPEPFSAVAVLAACAIARGDNPGLQRRLLAALMSGESVVALAWQERGEVLEPSQVATMAQRHGERFVLSGRKRFVAGGADADGFVVSARSGAGLELYWVPATARGLRVVAEPLLDGTFSASLELDAVDISAAERVASAATAAAALAAAFDAAVIAASAELLGAARAAFAMTLEYLRTRTQFGQTIGSFQALQHRAADCYVQIELAGAVLAEAAAAERPDLAPADRASLASRAKRRCGEAATLIAREGIQMHGAMGFTDGCDIGLYAKRMLVLSAWLGGIHYHARRFSTSLAQESTERPRKSSAAIPPQLRELPPETDWNALADADFRALVRDCVETQYPEDLRYLPRRVRWHEVRAFNLALAARGWIAPGWPRAWGGMGLCAAKQFIFVEELERWGVGRAPDQGVRQLGPVLFKYGSEAQRRTYLPKILSCEHIWCQGYSEPNAGSDLASVTTYAEQIEDGFVINGRKIWTSLATDATHIYVLCRTDRTAKKQRGISFIVVALSTPGITVEPIRDIAGNEEFCQVTFDNVRAPRENLVGNLNEGWTVAKAVLEFERLGVGSPHRPMMALNRLTLFAAKLGLFADQGFMDELTRLRMDLLDHFSLHVRYTDRVINGQGLGPEVSALKIWGMELFQRISEFALDRAGVYGSAAGPVALPGAEASLAAVYYASRLTTIGGGSNEIQRNILAKNVLRLAG
ncbi:MAG: acyl-CoA dehydrogenase family protein [Burkholderiales bacterium]|nr:acyl-CoA dehydrogenase family protein [Burkholderiales bacterium]